MSSGELTRSGSLNHSSLSDDTKRKLSLISEGSPAILTTQEMIQKLRRKDLIAWLAALFDDVAIPNKNDVPGFMRFIRDGTILCRLANIVKPASVVCPFPNPADASERAQNIQTFLGFCTLTIGLHESQLFQVHDLDREDNQELTDQQMTENEPRITHALLILGVVSNDLGHAPVPLQVDEAVELEDKDRQLRTSRSARQATLAAVTPSPQMNPKKLSIQRLPKERAVRFSLTQGPQTKVQIAGAEDMTAEQLAEFHSLTSGIFVPDGAPARPAKTGDTLAIPLVGVMDKRHQSKIPPLLDRHRSVGMAGGFSPILQLNIAALARDASEEEITITLTKVPQFATGDFVLVEDELMEVKGVMEDTVMVVRGARGTQREKHSKGTTVTHVVKDFEDVSETVSQYQILRHRALEEDFDDLDEMDFIELLEETSSTRRPSLTAAQSGSQRSLTTFVYIVSDRYDKTKNVDSKGQHNDERLLAYLIHRLEIVVQHRYSILYFHSQDTSHQLEFSFLSKAYGMLSQNFKTNLDNLWIVHPTMWVKMAFFVCGPFMDQSVSTKVFVCETLDDLYEDFDKDGLPLPASVIKSDQQRKAARWF